MNDAAADWNGYVRDHLPPLGVAPTREAEIVSELAQQLEQAYRSALAAGANEADARQRAESEIADWPALAQAIAAAEAPVAGRIRFNGGRLLGDLGRDLRLGMRRLRKGPGFALVVVLTLGLCIGAVTVNFSFFDMALLRVPPFPQANRILGVYPVVDGRPAWGNEIPAADYVDFRAGVHAFSAMAGYEIRGVNLTGSGPAEHVRAMAVTADFFRVLGAGAAQGRTFAPGEDQPGHDHVVVLSHALWSSRFASAPMLGKSITLDGAPYTVIGIMPSGFAYGEYDLQGALWVPLHITPAQREHRGQASLWFWVMGRLRPGATLAEARSQIQAIARQDANTYADEKGRGASVATLQDYFSRFQYNVQPSALFLSMTLSGLLLLVGCANVAGLGLGRAAARHDEMAIRRALGADRWRLIRQVLTETALLTIIAGVFGVLLGWVEIRRVNTLLPFLPMRLDGKVLVGTAVAVFAAVLGSGLPQALHLNARPHSPGASPRRKLGRDVAVAAQVALTVACLLLVTVVVRHLAPEADQPLGFNSGQLLVADIELAGSSYAAPSARAQFFGRMSSVTAALPAIRGAALVDPPPVNWNQATAEVRGRPPIDWKGKPVPKLFRVSRDYFATLQIPMLAGHVWTNADTISTAVVSLTAAHHLFPDGTNPVGQYIRLNAPGEPWREIVGECGDVASFPSDWTGKGEIYSPLRQSPGWNVGLLVRSAANVPPGGLASDLRRTLARLDPTLALFQVQPLQARMDTIIEGDKVFERFVVIMGAMALLLSAIGLYSIVAYSAAGRKQEIGIRMALGAPAGQLYRLLLGEAISLTLAGLAAGFGLGWLGVHVLAVGFGWVQANSLILFAVPGLVLIATAALAAYLPARRATRLDPWSVLRQE